MKTLIDRGNCSFGSKDATRMENIIKSKLDSDLKTPTAYDFLDVVSTLSVHFNNIFVILIMPTSLHRGVNLFLSLLLSNDLMP